MPPKLQAGVRIPAVKALKVARTQPWFGGTQVTLTWIEPEDTRFINGFNVLVTGVLDDNQQPLGPYFVKRSPIQIRLQTQTAARPTFTVQTLLANGQTSDVSLSPSVSTSIEAAIINPADIPNGTITIPMLANGTAGQLITWDNSGVADTIGPGTADYLLVGSGAGAEPQFKSANTLDFVVGRSNLTAAGKLVIVDSAGTVTQSTISDSSLVVAGTLTTLGRLPYVSGINTITSSFLYYNSVDAWLGIGISPASALHVYNSVLGDAAVTIESNAPVNNVKTVIKQNKVTTTDATPTTIHTSTIPSSTTVALDAIVVGRRTGGSAGTAEDSARYHLQAVFKNVAGTATLVGTINVLADEDQSSWDATFTPSSGDVLLEVTGAVNNDISWVVSVYRYEVSV